MIEIPIQLQKKNIKFIILGVKSKQPIEKDWVNTNNYLFNNPKLLDAISNNNNYGVATGNGLVVIDCDNIDMYNIVEKLFSNTFVVKTKKGFHFYLYCKSLTNKKILHINGNHAGEIQTNGQQVVGPNCIHPEGDVYTPLNNNEILEVQEIDIDRNLGMYYESYKKSARRDKLKHGEKKGGRNDFIFKESCISKREGFTIEETLLKMQYLNKKCEPPLPESEVKICVESAYSYDNDIKDQIMTLLKIKNFAKMSQVIIEEIYKNTRIYTIRDDKSKSEIWYYHDGIYLPNAQTYINEMCLDLLGENCFKRFVTMVTDKIIFDTYINKEEFFENKNIELVAIQNGILNLRTREVTDFNPDIIFFNKMPMKYNPDSKCPNILKHFDDVLKYKEDIPILQEMFGYLLWKEMFIEKAFMFIGQGRNGKGKSISLMSNFIGASNHVNISLKGIESDHFALADLHNKMANFAGDIENTELQNSSKFKELIGRDNITADRKFLGAVTFKSYAKMIFCANELPKSNDDSDGFYARWIYVEFPYKFVNEKEYNAAIDKTWLKIMDTDHIQKLSNKIELEGLLNWALDGLDRLLKNKTFSNSKNSEEIKNMWNRRSGAFKGFYNDMLEEDPNSIIIKSEFRRVYTNYCIKYKINKRCNDRDIKQALEIEGIEDCQIKMKHSWRGVRFKTNNYIDSEGFSFCSTDSKPDTVSSIKTFDVLSDF